MCVCVCVVCRYLYVQNDQTDVLRNFYCRERIPGLGVHNNFVVPSHQSGMKVNWYA